MKRSMNLTSLTRRTYRKRLMLAAIVTAATPLAMGATPTVHADEEWEENTILYEDDAWYDVSEWFDGNDYNPTDEAIGRWDNETYDVDEALTSNDVDNDIDWSDADFGFYAGNDGDWFYDYYDYDYTDYGDYDGNELYEYYSRYYDFDNDGVYDAFASYTDSDGDGYYEDMDYYSFSGGNAEDNQRQREQAEQDQKSVRSEMLKVNGSIETAKKVQTPGSTNLVVQLNQADSEGTVAVDLGPIDAYDPLPRLGQSVTVMGSKFKTGEKSILVAQKVKHDDQTKEGERSGRKFTGTVQKLMALEIRGTSHQFAKIQTDDGKSLLVDMGPAENLEAELSEGDQVSVTGPAVEFRDRLMLVANQITKNDSTESIDRLAME